MALSDYPLLEREKELAEIEAAISRGSSGEGLCLVIEGPPGLGKTRLLDAARGFAQDEGCRVLAARAGEREREYSWGTVRSLLEPILVASDPEELEELWSGPAAAARSPLEGTTPPAEGNPDSSYAIFNGIYWLVRRLADRQPLLLAIDDLHWVDGASLGFLEFLSRRLGEMPVVLAATLRPNEPGTDVALIGAMTAEPAVVVRPQPLSPEGSAAVLRERLGEQMAKPVLREAHDVTGGNPLLLSEIARTIEIEGPGAETTALEGDIAKLGARAVARTVELRLARASDEARRLAGAAAVAGEDAQLVRAVELAGLEEDEAAQAALDLVRIEVLRPGTKVRFVHPVVRAAIYDSLAAPERVRLHREAVEIMRRVSAPASLIANHLLRVDPAGDPETVSTLRQAAVLAAAGGDSRSATLLMRRALEEPPPPDQVTGVLAQLGAAEVLVDGPSAAEHLGMAIERVDELPFKVALAEILARILVLQERVSEAVAICEDTVAAIPEGEALEWRRRIEAIIAEASVVDPINLKAEQLAHADRLLEEGSRITGDDYGTRALMSLSTVAGSRDLSASAEELAARARAAAAGMVLIREGINSITQLGPAQILALAGHHAESITLLNESLRWDERYGSVVGHLANLIFRAWAHLFAGDLHAAVEDSAGALVMSHSYRLSPGICWSAWIQVEALLRSGDIERARAVVAEEFPLDTEPPGSWHWMNPIVVRGRLRLHDGDAEGALAEARRAGEIYAAARGVGSTWVVWRPLAVEALLALGNVDEARELAETELELARRWGAPRQLGVALRSLAAADESRREELLTEAVAVLDGSEARLELAGALVDLGAEMRRRNRKSGSREPLLRGMDLAQDCGAAPLAGRAQTELRASGMRVRRTALSGPDSLTDSERRVAELAAAGKTNREIAGELFVTVKTVEVHLSNTYRKLGIPGRRQLAQAI